MSVPPTLGPATIADLIAIPEEDRRHEIIDGFLVEKGAATYPHGLAQSRVGLALAPYNRSPGGRSPGGWWFVTEVEIILETSQVCRPDMTGWRRDRLPAEPDWPVSTKPDWVCEVLSTNRQNDLVKKKRALHRHQVPPDRLTVERREQAGAIETHVGVANKGSVVTSFEGAVMRTHACDALVGLGWKPHIAKAAVHEACGAVGEHVSLEVLIREALRRCPRPTL